MIVFGSVQWSSCLYILYNFQVNLYCIQKKHLQKNKNKTKKQYDLGWTIKVRSINNFTCVYGTTLMVEKSIILVECVLHSNKHKTKKKNVSSLHVLQVHHTCLTPVKKDPNTVARTPQNQPKHWQVGSQGGILSTL